MSKFLYKQIKDYLLQLVTDNKNVPHYKLPSENQIAVKFNTSRITAKRALTELQEEGYIYRIQGKGSFLKQFRRNYMKLQRSTVQENWGYGGGSCCRFQNR
jgi:DNA-binding GntR family transcriptional regulator